MFHGFAATTTRREKGRHTVEDGGLPMFAVVVSIEVKSEFVCLDVLKLSNQS
jgi:hypothetical protein